MDADGRLIPITEDDQGEGFKDIVDLLETEEGRRMYKEAMARADKAQQSIMAKMLNK